MYNKPANRPNSVKRLRRKEEEEVKTIFQTGLLFIARGFESVKAVTKLAGPIPNERVLMSFKVSSIIDQPKFSGKSIGDWVVARCMEVVMTAIVITNAAPP